jgi:hypothetical protein
MPTKLRTNPSSRDVIPKNYLAFLCIEGYL